jgi:hypothetical protein
MTTATCPKPILRSAPTAIWLALILLSVGLIGSLNSTGRSITYRLLRFIWRTGKRSLSSSNVAAGVLRNALMTLLGQADYKRWKALQHHEKWWDERTKEIARLIPAGSNVIEFGAGRRQLERFLPADCTYTPSDLVDRGPGTFVCDLNRLPLPDLRQLGLNVAVFGGVLEYIKDVPSLVSWIASMGIRTCIASFDSVPQGISFFDRFNERIRRYRNGYRNNLTEEQLFLCFEAARMRCEEKRAWTTQGIYRFVRLPS